MSQQKDKATHKLRDTFGNQKLVAMGRNASHGKDSASMSMINVFPSLTVHSTQLFPLRGVTAETARPFSNAQ